MRLAEAREAGEIRLRKSGRGQFGSEHHHDEAMPSRNGYVMTLRDPVSVQPFVMGACGVDPYH